MPHKSFYGKQVGSVLIQVCTKGMAEGMAGKPVIPSHPVLVGMDIPGKEKGVNEAVFSVLFWKKETHWSAAFKPVLSKKIKDSFGENGITIISAFGVCDVKPHVFCGQHPHNVDDILRRYEVPMNTRV